MLHSAVHGATNFNDPNKTRLRVISTLPRLDSVDRTEISDVGVSVVVTSTYALLLRVASDTVTPIFAVVPIAETPPRAVIVSGLPGNTSKSSGHRGLKDGET
jgi:hypothetical protein